MAGGGLALTLIEWNNLMKLSIVPSPPNIKT
jgi:hypothetical protein